MKWQTSNDIRQVKSLINLMSLAGIWRHYKISPIEKDKCQRHLDFMLFNLTRELRFSDGIQDLRTMTSDQLERVEIYMGCERQSIRVSELNVQYYSSSRAMKHRYQR